MLPKSSERVAKVIKLANAVAREYERDYVGTEHVLLAIAREGSGVGSRVLAGRGITEGSLKSEVDKLIKKQMEETWVFGRLPGTPHFKNVMATAIKQCQSLGANELRTEHLLLALLRERGSVAHKALANLGLKFEDARSDVQRISSPTRPANPAAEPGPD